MSIAPQLDQRTLERTIERTPRGMQIVLFGPGCLVGYILGWCLASLGNWNPTAFWTAVLAAVTAVQVWFSIAYQRIVHQQFGLQERQFADYMRPRLIWDLQMDEGSKLWFIAVRNVGRGPAVIGKVAFDGGGGDVLARTVTQEPVSFQCAAVVAEARGLSGGKLTVPYFDALGNSYTLVNSIEDVAASCLRQGFVQSGHPA